MEILERGALFPDGSEFKRTFNCKQQTIVAGKEDCGRANGRCELALFVFEARRYQENAGAVIELPKTNDNSKHSMGTSVGFVIGNKKAISIFADAMG